VGAAQAEAAPGFGDDDAVGWVAGVEADLDGEIDADLADVLGEVGDVLGALVSDAGDAVAVEKDGGGGGSDGCGVMAGGCGDEPLGLGDAAVCNAAGAGEVVAADMFALGGGDALAGEENAGGAGDGGEPEAEDGEVPRRAEEGRQVGWDRQRHGSSADKDSANAAEWRV
jgi:hypothetical protein